MAGKVIFTAVADHGGYVGPDSADKTVVFNTVITNIGSSYSNTTGVFAAPVAGVYYFTFSYHAGKQNKSGLSLMKNGSLVVKALDNNEKGEYFTDNAGNSAFLELKQGDQVFLRLPVNHHVWTSNNTTSFSGFLLSQELQKDESKTLRLRRDCLSSVMSVCC